MKNRTLIIMMLVGFSLLLLVGGCDEEKSSPAKSEQQTNLQASNKAISTTDVQKEPDIAEIKSADMNTPKPRGTVKGPRISFEKTTCDLGVIGTSSTNLCEFEFTNIGDETLEITNIKTTCGCTTAKLPKTKFEPSESNSIKVTYHAGAMTESAMKNIYVSTNDATAPNVQLTIKAKVTKKVEVKPDMLKLSLKEQNAGCPDITLQSTDNIPFAITQVTSTANCITIDFDRSQKLPKYIIKPKVDAVKLEQILSGNIQFTLTHPQCNSVTVNFNAPSEFSTSPPTLLVLNAQPEVPTIRDQIWIVNNYSDDFEIEKIYSQKGYIKHLSTEKAKKGRFVMKLEITPPKKETTNSFTDTLTIKIKGGKEVTIPCRGYFKK